MLTGERPSETAARALDVALILHADHELNASTFAARVTAATLSDMHSAVTAAIGTLKGRYMAARTRLCSVSWKSIDRSGADPVEYVQRHAGAEEEGSWFRSSRVSHRRSAGDAPAKDV